MAQKIVFNSGKVIEENSGGGKSSGSGSEQKVVFNSGKTVYVSSGNNSLRKDVDSLAQDANQFIRIANWDTTGEKRFNAADYFEERKKQADALKQRAAAISLYLEDNAGLYTPEYYDSLMQTLSTFNTEVDDVLSLYQPALDSRAGMRAYEDEFIAAQERNAQQKQLEKASDFAFEPGSFAANMMPLMRQKLFDEGDRGVKDNWSAEQRYRLGLMQMDDPNQAKDYAKEVNAGRDPYLAYQQQEQQKADWRAMDLNAERREIDRLKAELDDYYWNSNYDATSTNARNAFDQEVKRREKEISDREKQYNLAKREQDNAQFRSAAERSDFAAKSGYVSTGFQMPNYVEDADPDELVYEYINNPEIRGQINQQTIELAQKGYDLLEPEEVSIYNYYYATEGPGKAQQYLDNIQDTLNQRFGERGAASKDQLWKQLMAGAISGYSNAVTSPQYFFDKESDYINTSPFQYMSAAIREDLADTGKHPFFDTSLGQMGYDLVNTTANMLPSIMLSKGATAIMPGVGAAIGALGGKVATPWLGSAISALGSGIAANAPQIGAAVGSSVMGLSAAGGAYQQALNAGYTKEQAKRYAALSGASEVALEYLLGGISKLGGEIPQAVLSNMVSGVDNAIARAAITLGGSMASEGFEEGLQEVITPWIENLTLYADKNVDWNEVAYSTLLGALSGGLMEGPGIVSSEIRSARANNLMELAAQKVDAEMATASMTAEQVAEMKPTTSADGNARLISENRPVDVVEFAEVNDGKATVKLKDGTAEYQDISFGTEKQGNQYFAVESLPLLDTAHANKLLHTIQEADAGNDTTEVMAIREAYRLGYMGATTQELRGSGANVLPTNLQDQIYSIGQQQRTANDAVKAAASTARTKATAGYKKVVIEGKLSRVTLEAAKKRKAEIEYVDRIADTFAGTAVHVYESYEKNGKRYYKDNSGKEQLAPNGKYVNDEIWLDLKSGDNGDGLMLNTFAHEMYHHIEKWNKPKARELAEFVVKELGLKTVDKAVVKQIQKARAAGYGEKYFQDKQHMTAEQAQNEVYMRAMSDFVADSLETMFTQGDPAKAIANLKKENQGLFDQIKAFIDEWISKVKKFYSDKTISQEGAVVAQLKNFEELQRLFMEAMKGAGENYRAALESVVEENAKPVDADDIKTDGAYITDGEGEMYSIRSMKEDIAEGKMFEDLKTYCGWTQKQVDTLRDQLNDLVAYMTPFRDILDLNETYGKNGRRFSPYKPNSDPLYKISMDFSTLCSKRLLTQYVIENLQLRENRPMSAEEQMAIRDMLNEYRKQEKGLQVACAMCYVEAARLKSPKQMQRWMSDPETYMRNYFADKDPDFAAYIKGKQEDFKESRGYARNAPKKDMSSKDVDALNKIRPRLRAEYKPSAGEQAIIEKAKSLPNSTYLTAANLANLSESDPTIYAAYTAFVRTATRSKSLETDEPYYYGDSRRDNGNGIVVTDSFIEEVNRENGMRFSSWSDWRIQHMLDYITAVIDNAVRGAAMHGYTKFPEEVRVLGKTGMMFNMSGVAGTQNGLNEDGSLSFSDTESINRDEAVQLREEFPETAGLQCIGVSDEHIVELLKSEIIDYVIPYHVSGLNKGLRSMANIHGWKDYTSTQHAAIDKNAKLSDAKDQEHWHEEPVFSEFFVGYSTGMTGIETMRASADQYKKMCADRGMKPKFEQFAKEPNYWKLLIDRKMINQKTGDLIQQKPVTPTFDFDTIKAVVDRHVDNYDSNMEARALNHIVENWDGIPKRIRDLKKQGSKKPVKKSIDNLSNQTLAAQPVDQFSLRNQQPTAREILTQVDITKRTKGEQWHLNQYRDRLQKLSEVEPQLEDVQARIKELEADGKKHPELTELRSQERSLRNSVNNLKRDINKAERYDMFQKIVAQERRKIDKKQNENLLKSYKDEQRKMVEEMQMDQRMLREMMTGTQSLITIMEDKFVDLVKAYENKEISRKDMKTEFVRLATEYKTQVKDNKTLEREFKRLMNTYDSETKIWETEFNRLIKLYDKLSKEYETESKNAKSKIKRLQDTILRQRQTAKDRVTSRRNTEMRQKIQRKANELNQILLHGSKHRNIPEYLQPAVADILNAINMEVRDGDQRRASYEATLARYDRQIAMTNNPAEVSRLIEKRNQYAAKGDQFANKMAELKEAYQKIQDDKIPNMEIDEGLASRLMELFVVVGDTPLGQMTREQLDAVNDVLDITKATIRNANELLAEERAVGVVESSKSAIMEIKSAGDTKKKKTPIRKKLEQFGWNNLKPVYAFDVIGSKTLNDRYEALRRGEDTLAVDLNEAKDFFQEQWKKNSGKDWDMEQKWKFTSTSGKSFELDLNQIMSLYALAKDKDARSHLRVGGFAFDSDYQTKEDINIGPVKIPVKMESTDASAYNLSDEILGEIISKLTPQQRAFADAMQAYLSDTMAAKGNEVSLKKYGIRLFKKKDYFPIRVADQFLAKAREQNAGDRKIKDSGFTKDRKPEAKNPVVLSGFTKVWAEHVDEMSLYHSFVLPLDDFNRVLNYHNAFVEGEQAVSVVEAITNAFGNGAVNYIDQLIKDVNGGIRGGSTVSFANSLVSKAKKAQTMASLSVAIQQPSSIIRAMSMIDSRYFIGHRVTEKTHNRTWDEIKQYAPIAYIKEMGGYDTNVGKSTVDYLTDTADYETFGEKFGAMFTDSKFRDDALGRLPALMDEMSWGVIWNAVKREQSAQHPNMDVNNKAFMKLVADRFTDVITRTQVYDSVFSRSGLMRDKNDLAKVITSFMAEPTTTANMLAVSVLQAKRGDISKAEAVKTTAAIVASLALNAALKSIVYAMRDDDEDKRYDEKWVENFRNDFFESLNPAGYIPYVRDIYNVFVKGYDVERADMELFGDLQNALDGLKNDDISAWDKTSAVIGSIGNLLGVPVKNILRDVKGIVQTAGFAWDDKPNPKTKTGSYMAWRGMDLNDKEQMILAIQSGDEEHLQRVFGRFENQQKAESALQSAIGEQYRSGNLSAEEAQQLLTDNFDREDEHEVYWLFDKWDYAKENGSAEGWTKYGKLLEGVESGDFQSEMNRLMEHGAEASDIRSQISRVYRKKYLENPDDREEIQNKLQPVYEATGMHDDEILQKFHDWDFEAEYGMTYGEMKGEYRDGNVTESELRQAMKFYGRKNYQIEEDIRNLNKEIKFFNKYEMSLSEMKDAYDRGDVSRNTMIGAQVFNGMTKKEAQEWVNQRDISNSIGIDFMELDDAYKYGDISRTTLRNAILKNGETPEKADEAMMGYDWLKKNVKRYPDLAISDAKKFAVRIHSDYAPDETLEDYGVSIDAYIEYQRLRPECKGVDANGDGKTDDGTLRDSVFRMIDSLPISSEAKDGLALMSYSAKSIRRNAPWH